MKYSPSVNKFNIDDFSRVLLTHMALTWRLEDVKIKGKTKEFSFKTLFFSKSPLNDEMVVAIENLLSAGKIDCQRFIDERCDYSDKDFMKCVIEPLAFARLYPENPKSEIILETTQKIIKMDTSFFKTLKSEIAKLYWLRIYPQYFKKIPKDIENIAKQLVLESQIASLYELDIVFSGKKLESKHEFDVIWNKLKPELIQIVNKQHGDVHDGQKCVSMWHHCIGLKDELVYPSAYEMLIVLINYMDKFIPDFKSFITTDYPECRKYIFWNPRDKEIRLLSLKFIDIIDDIIKNKLSIAVEKDPLRKLQVQMGVLLNKANKEDKKREAIVKKYENKIAQQDRTIDEIRTDIAKLENQIALLQKKKLESVASNQRG